MGFLGNLNGERVSRGHSGCTEIGAPVLDGEDTQRREQEHRCSTLPGGRKRANTEAGEKSYCPWLHSPRSLFLTGYREIMSNKS